MRGLQGAPVGLQRPVQPGDHLPQVGQGHLHLLASSAAAAAVRGRRESLHHLDEEAGGVLG